MSFERPFLEGKEGVDEETIPLQNPINFFRIDVSSNPTFNLVIMPTLVDGASIGISKGGSYTRWNYNNDKTISSWYNPSLVIATLATTANSPLYLKNGSTANIYKKWTWNPTTNTFTLDANPQLMMTIGNNNTNYQPVILQNSTTGYNQFNIVLPWRDMSNISIGTFQNPSLLMSAYFTDPEPHLGLGTTDTPLITWNYSNMLLYASNNTSKFYAYGDGLINTTLPSITSPYYNQYLWIWNDTDGTFINEFTKNKLGSANLTYGTHVNTDYVFYTQWMIICNKNSNFDDCQEWCGQFPKDCINVLGPTCLDKGTNMWNTDYCKKFCLSTTPDNRTAYCDTNMTTYCADPKNANSVECGCINIQPPFTFSKGFCVDPKCNYGSSYLLGQQDVKNICTGNLCIQFASGQGNDYYQQVKQTLCCDQDSGKLVNRNTSGATCASVPDGGNSPMPNDITIFGILGTLSGLCICCVVLLIIVLLIYYLLE